MAITKTLFGDIDKPKVAIDRIRQFEPPEGYLVGFSGGKDSLVVYDLVKRAGVRHDAQFKLTTVDPPELVHFVRKNFPEVRVVRPAQTMWQIIRHKRMAPTLKARFCCEQLKEYGDEGRIIITGIRWEESSRRSKRMMVEACKKGLGRRFVHPIIDWTVDEVWSYIRENNIPYPSLYDEGYKRLGCIMCPLQTKEGMARDAARWPKYYDAYLRSFAALIESRKAAGMTLLKPTAEEYMKWWMSREPAKDDSYEDQLTLFDSN